MGKYKLVIAKAIGGDEVRSVEFQEKIQEEAKTKIYKMLLKETSNFNDGEYTGRLFRKNDILDDWEEVSGTPMIACKVESSKASLTVKRVVYGTEEQYLKRLLDIHGELHKLQMQYMVSLNSKNVISPLPVLSLDNEIVQIINTLHNDYDPEYLQSSVYPNVINNINNISSDIQNSFDSYAKSSHPDYYTSEIAKRIGEIQLVIQSIFSQLQIELE